MEGLGIDGVTVTGDTRFDRVMQIAKESRSIPAIKAFCNGRKTFIAGSSWLPDEQIFLPYLAQHRDWKVIIAPHVIGESHLEQIMKLLEGRKVVRYTQIDAAGATTLGDAEVMIIDCFGLLSSIYKYGDVAYVGGGFGAGIHNLPEAAVWNLPVVFGPNHQKFQEALELIDCGGGFAIESADDFGKIMDSLIASETELKKAADAAGYYVKSHSGATERLLQMLQQKAETARKADRR